MIVVHNRIMMLFPFAKNNTFFVTKKPPSGSISGYSIGVKGARGAGSLMKIGRVIEGGR